VPAIVLGRDQPDQWGCLWSHVRLAWDPAARINALALETIAALAELSRAWPPRLTARGPGRSAPPHATPPVSLTARAHHHGMPEREHQIAAGFCANSAPCAVGFAAAAAWCATSGGFPVAEAGRNTAAGKASR
jgi:hypothetical protein